MTQSELDAVWPGWLQPKKALAAALNALLVV